jgi:hypothetical protein
MCFKPLEMFKSSAHNMLIYRHVKGPMMTKQEWDTAGTIPDSSTMQTVKCIKHTWSFTNFHLCHVFFEAISNTICWDYVHHMHNRIPPRTLQENKNRSCIKKKKSRRNTYMASFAYLGFWWLNLISSFFLRTRLRWGI